jgi:DNA primase
MEDLVTSAHAAMSSEIRQQLWVRGVSDEQIDCYRMGCLAGARLPESIDCAPSFRAWWAVHRRRFRNALVFPLTSTLGATHGLQFRDVNSRIRGYLDYYEYKEEPAFFGLAQAMPGVWATEEIWLVEGVFDLCPIQRHVSNVVATLHAGVSKQLARVLHRIARTLVIAYDMDSTGRKVSYDLARDMKGLFEVVILKLPRVRLATGVPAKDPNELWSAWGDATLGAFLQKWRARPDALIEDWR